MIATSPASHQAIYGPSLQAITAADFAMIAELVHARSGIVLGLDKAYLVESRLEHLVRDVVEAVTINETLFFRDIRPFEHLCATALPTTHAALPLGQPLRIWSAASSSGQEAYSIAMAVMDAGLSQRTVQIVGIDISTEQLSRARLGVYSDFEMQRGIIAPVLGKYFQKARENWQTKDAVRRMVEFRRWNLMVDLRPLGTFDLIFCRNVLIYFDVDTKRRVLNAIWARLAPGGWLYLGGAETTFGISGRFIPCSGTHQVYTAVRA